MSYNVIYHPISGNTVNTNSKLGKIILNNYIYKNLLNRYLFHLNGGGIFDKIKQGVKSGTQSIKQGAESAGRKIKRGANKAIDTTPRQAAQGVASAAQAVKQGAIAQGQRAVGAVNNAAQAVKQGAIAQGQRAVGAVNNAAQAVKQGAIDQGQRVMAQGQRAVGAVNNAAQAVKQGAIAQGQRAVGAVNNAAQAVKQGAIAQGQRAVGAVNNAAQKTLQSLYNVALNQNTCPLIWKASTNCNEKFPLLRKNYLQSKSSNLDKTIEDFQNKMIEQAQKDKDILEQLKNRQETTNYQLDQVSDSYTICKDISKEDCNKKPNCTYDEGLEECRDIM